MASLIAAMLAEVLGGSSTPAKPASRGPAHCRCAAPAAFDDVVSAAGLHFVCACAVVGAVIDWLALTTGAPSISLVRADDAAGSAVGGDAPATSRTAEMK